MASRTGVRLTFNAAAISVSRKRVPAGDLFCQNRLAQVAIHLIVDTVLSCHRELREISRQVRLAFHSCHFSFFALHSN